METEDDLATVITEGDTICTICDAEFLDPEDLTLHLTQVHASEPSGLLTCHFCASSLSDLESYACHIRDTHLQSLKLCSYCSKAFIDVDQFKKHQRKHYSAKNSHKKCSQCDSQFDNMSALELHEYQMHNNNLDGILLRDYTPIFSSVLNSNFFNFIRSVDANESYKCTLCNFEAVDLKKYINHLQKYECRSFACNTCSCIGKTKRHIFRHIKKNKKCSFFTKNSITQSECPHCFQKIKSIFYYDHVKQCRPIKCSLCNIVFTSMNLLSEHQSKLHPSSIEVKVCKFCSRQCVGHNPLMKHMNRVHKQEFHLYKYKCIQCETVFKHPQRLFTHYFLLHKDLEPYKCNICDMNFKLRKRFTLHIKLKHDSVGFVEFDENYHVFFSAKKSEKPFILSCAIPEEELRMYEEYEEQIGAKKDGKNQTDIEEQIINSDSKNLKRKKKMGKMAIKRLKKYKEERMSPNSSDDDDDKPLVSLQRKMPPKKRVQLSFKTKSTSKNSRNRLTCNICNKYCYTYQNYQHHMSLHKKKEQKVCIKCSKMFRSKEKLQQHIKTEHSSSKLTETLRMLLEKRKMALRAVKMTPVNLKSS